MFDTLNSFQSSENVSGGKPLRDFLEVKCHDTAVKVVFGAALKGLSLDINNIQFIQSLHKVCLPPQLEVSFCSILWDYALLYFETELISFRCA